MRTCDIIEYTSKGGTAVDTILKTYGLSKQYKGQFAVRDANMCINAGDIYGFVGENGSGKTTIIRLITGLIHPMRAALSSLGL